MSFRDWAQRFNGTVEVVAVEAPGRGTRINETAVDDLDGLSRVCCRKWLSGSTDRPPFLVIAWAGSQCSPHFAHYPKSVCISSSTPLPAA